MDAVLERLNAELTIALHGLDALQTQWKPMEEPDKWTIQQIVEHLLLSYRSTLGVFQMRLDKGSPTKATPMLAQRAAQVTLLTFGYFPRGRKAPPPVMPGPSEHARDGKELSAIVGDQLVLLSQTSDEALQLFGSGSCASHMVMGPLSVPQWRRFHLVHGRHHIKQIRRIRDEHMF